MELLYRNVSEKKLTTTSPTTILKFTPDFAGNFSINIYYRVANVITDVTITLTWTDVGGSQLLDIVPLTNSAIGSYLLSPIFINSTATDIILTATSGTSNNLFISATIQGVL